jgi:RNA polymerase binding protein RbpA/transcriptional regulator MftR-like protein
LKVTKQTPIAPEFSSVVLERPVTLETLAEAIAARTGTDLEQDMYPRILAGAVIAAAQVAVRPPPQWECRVCSQPAGTDPLDPPSRVARYMGEKTHLERVRDRRTQVEGDRLMAESLARRDHPEEFNVWAGPRGRKV